MLALGLSLLALAANPVFGGVLDVHGLLEARAIGSLCSASLSGRGTCQTTSSSCLAGFSLASGCPNDPSTVGCCISRPCYTSAGTGICRKTSQGCSGGTFYTGYCPGDSTTRCCVDSQLGTSCKTSAGYGACIDTSNGCASGSFYTGFCPGGSNIKCCVPTGATGGAVFTLNTAQSNHVRTIANVAKAFGMPKRACIVGIATAMQESTIRVLANSNVPTSYNYPYEGVGSDHDSVGIFQQRPLYWGTVKDCMDPPTSAGKFFNALNNVSGWQSMTIAVAAQTVQKSAYPTAYAKWETLATNACNAVW